MGEPSRLEKLQEELNLEDDKEVRIIVELKEQPVLAEYGQYNAKASQALEVYQTEVQDDIAQSSIDLTYEHQFTNAVNGFSATTTLADAKRVEKLPEVKRVFIANEYLAPKPEMISSGKYVDKGKAITYDPEYDGEGTVVAVIDTGIDYTHKDMRLSDGTKPALTQGNVSELVAKNSLKGRYYTSKVPYGYNYFDRNDEVIDVDRSASMHGMHVAGTVAANTADEEGINGVKGIAPEAQVLAMKVFGNNPSYESTYGDIIIAAIDDSIALGADVINMSLGSTSGFVDANDLEQDAVQRATDAGILCAISAGNSGFFGDRGTNVENMDTALVGSPGVSLNALQVASMENSTTVLYTIKNEGNAHVYKEAGPYNPRKVLKGQVLEYVEAGIGEVDEVLAANVKGKVALIKRGAFSFSTKVKNAQEEGAVAVIIYNHESGGEDIVSMSVEGITIPAVFVPNSVGVALTKATNKTLSFPEEKKIIQNPFAGEMSDFSSWGPVSTLDLKPEITAPGGEIYSTLNSDQYGMMSGTSMAAPHVAGVMSLIYQRINKQFPELKGTEKALFAKNLAMSSAKLQLGGIQNETPFKAYITPRQQGAGLININNAVRTPVILTDVKSGEVEVDLLEVGNDIEFSVKLTNLTDQPVTGDLKGIVQTPFVEKGKNGNFLTDYSSPIYKSNNEYLPITVNGESVTLSKGMNLTVPAKGEVVLKATIDLRNAKALNGEEYKSLNEIFPNGTFVEGYLTFDGTVDEEPFHMASIPYMGFYGEWDELPILDATYLEKNRKSVYGMAGFLNQETAFIGKEDGLVVAGNIEGQPQMNRVIWYLPTLLRNAKVVQLSILDESKNTIRILDALLDARKNFKSGKNYTFNSDLAWDLTVNGQLVPGGKYYVRAEAVIDFEGAKTQVYDYPVFVDHTVSEVNKIVIGEDKDTLTIVGTPKGMGIDTYGFVTVSDAGEVKSIYSETGSFSLAEIKKQLFSGKFTLYPKIYSKNGAVALGAPLSEKIILASEKGDIKSAEFSKSKIRLNLGKDLVDGEFKVIAKYDVTSTELKETIEKSAKADPRKIVYTSYDKSIVEFEDNSSFKVVKEGETAVEGLYVTNLELLKDLVGVEKAMTTTPAVTSATTPGVLKFVENPEGKLKDYKAGEDYFNLSSKVIVENTKRPLGATEGDTTPPQVMVKSPEYNSILTSVSGGSVKITGTITDESELKNLKINNVNANGSMKYNNATQQYDFAYTLPVTREGLHNFNVEVEDAAGNKVEFDHRFFYDGTAPLITPQGEGTVVENGNMPYLAYPIIVKDSYASYSVYVNDNLLAKRSNDFSSYEYYRDPKNTVLSLTDLKLPLSAGENTYIIKAVDEAGNVSVLKVTKTYGSSDTSTSSGGSSSGSSSSSSSTNTGKTTVTKTQVQKIVKAAEDKDEIEIKGKKVTTSGVTVRFSKTLLEEAQKVDKHIKFNFENIAVTLSSKALADVKDTYTELVVKKKVSKDKTLASDIYDFTFKGTKSDAKALNTFEEPVLLTLPVKLAKGEDVNSYAVQYYNEESKKWEVVGGVYNEETKTMTAPVSHFSKYAVKKNAVNFADVKEGHWAKGAIDRLASKGIINGKSEKSFDPKGILTYAEFVKLIVEAKGLTTEEVEGKWYEKYLKVAVDEKIITVAEKVKADQEISRAEMAVIIARVVEGVKVLESKIEAPGPITYTDTVGLEDDAKESIHFVSKQGLLNGRGDNLFAPKATLTRAEAAVVIDRLLDKLYK